MSQFVPVTGYYVKIDRNKQVVPMVHDDQLAWLTERGVSSVLTWKHNKEHNFANYHLLFEDDALAVEYVLTWK